ncbi:hypothetical protein HME9304_02969 [Flagellimonas maritima]|uniref:Uncharacterized protein n=1 Tax=Flagellimonas maritima TaxID=1383885 RepID=A0A2Z4LXC7_9FLAO|nr:hypothetical protein [Allomuricauda aurantiaca]AWX45937.1 hypothetical protein HME9304_02969 [Allomuricauda aurantiaca]
MVPKSYVLFLYVCIFVTNISFSGQCDNFYAKVTYGLNHTKSALKATNFEHQTYYAERALIALEKSKAFMEECGCPKAKDKTLDAMEALKKAIDPVDWDAGRYFSKKSKGIINELITILDECTLGMPQTVVVEDNAESTIENEAYANTEENEQVSMEAEMIKVFDKHSAERLSSLEKSIEQITVLSKSFVYDPTKKESDPNSLEAHQKAYLAEARRLLEKGLKELDR